LSSLKTVSYPPHTKQSFQWNITSFEFEWIWLTNLPQHSLDFVWTNPHQKIV
jgi:hypothetical protein